jgi:uncharacterized protein YfbU (UPF0304 family)
MTHDISKLLNKEELDLMVSMLESTMNQPEFAEAKEKSEKEFKELKEIFSIIMKAVDKTPEAIDIPKDQYESACSEIMNITSVYSILENLYKKLKTVQEYEEQHVD